MTPEKWQTASRLVQAVLQRAPVERAAFVAAACAGDERLRQEVESLLEVHRQTGQLDATDVEVVTNQMTGGLKANQTSPLYDGRLLGHYQLQHEIGRGGMGRVYLAQDTRLG